MVTPTRLRIQQAIFMQEFVSICESDEGGAWKYAVVLDHDQEFWLDSFRALEEAHAFIKSNNLPLKQVLLKK